MGPMRPRSSVSDAGRARFAPCRRFLPGAMATEDLASHEGEELVRFERADAYKEKQALFLRLLVQDNDDPALILQALVSEVRCDSHP